MTVVEIQTLNQVAANPEWTRSALDLKRTHREADGTPSREDERRYNQTAAPRLLRRQGRTTSRGDSDRLFGNHLVFVAGTFRDVHRTRHGLSPLLDHSDSPALFGSQFHFVAKTFSRVFGRDSS